MNIIMAKIKFLVDTGSDLPQEYLDKYDVDIVPVTVIIDGKSYKDYYEYKGPEFAQYMRTCTKAPTTSQPSPIDFLTYFEKYSKDYDHIICITMTPAGSGTYNSACLAKGMYEEKEENTAKVHLIDSRSCGLVETLELRIAGDMAAEGKSVEEIIARLDDVRFRVATFFLVDNVDFLIKGGRVSVVKGKVASKLNLKPIVAIREGEGSVLSNAMGFTKGVDKLIGYYESEAEEGATVYLSHTDTQKHVDLFLNKFKEKFPNVECVVTNMFCTMSTQAGPDALGLFYLKKK